QFVVDRLFGFEGHQQMGAALQIETELDLRHRLPPIGKLERRDTGSQKRQRDGGKHAREVEAGSAGPAAEVQVKERNNQRDQNQNRSKTLGGFHWLVRK